MSVYCDEQADVYDERTIRARKEHRCSACRETIAPGHRYVRVAIVFDGTVETVKRCLRCQEIHLAVRKVTRGTDLWPDERLNCGLDWVEEHGELPPEVARLAFVTAEEMQGGET